MPENEKAVYSLRIRIRRGTAEHWWLLEADEVSCRADPPEVTKYECRLSRDAVAETRVLYTNVRQALEAYLRTWLQTELSKLNPSKDTIDVVEDSHELLKKQSVFCQHCGRKLLETFGPSPGVLKRCPRCRNLSFPRDEAWMRQFRSRGDQHR